jgi:DNA-binding MarR family transcriptional regulator
VARQFDLSHAALNALAVVEGAGAPVAAGDIGTRMHITSGSVTALLDNLERKGYVTRRADPGDRRKVMVDITPDAQKVLDEMLPAVQQLARHVFSGTSATEQHALLDALAAARAALVDLPDELPPPEPRNRPAHLSR